MSASAEPRPFSQPVIRHLAWLCRAPQLYHGDQTFHPRDWLPADHEQVLRYWDRHPDNLPPLLQPPFPRRLGLYVEQLYACLLQDLLGWTLLARNLQIREGQRTLGELDFLVLNTATQQVEHHEIAVKFYLGHDTCGRVRWYGTNTRDRLDLKTDRLLQHQAQMTTTAAGQACLADLGVIARPRVRLFMPGYLFQPLEGLLPVPAQVAPDHGAGRWCHVADSARLPPMHWVVLHKPHWLGPWQQPATPEIGLLQQVAEQVEHDGRACLLARMEPALEGWQETERLFVVPNAWPGSASLG
ncbi:DUF1853 family protein [Marinobacterium weihaiense]|uniref:DUF1853 family protein n=1 Tax=Marinobacterium weihaiense TaxID=2851016 RepID=A0ABS6M991_9GAMM|nr:DUF1853 family protein [Marinobacterium weihaiense]MBV0932842.1 DUF1853 family protein [Marinobacterium weihaiense]